MPRTPLIHLMTVLAVAGCAQVASAQAPPASAPRLDQPAPLGHQYNCPPGVDPKDAPLLGESETSGSGGTLSEQLSHSRGVVCPPKGIDPSIVETPPESGTLRVIPPPHGDVVPK
jgi:hypothetical protein